MAGVGTWHIEVHRCLYVPGLCGENGMFRGWQAALPRPEDHPTSRGSRLQMAGATVAK